MTIVLKSKVMTYLKYAVMTWGIAISLFTVGGCDDSDEGKSRITAYDLESGAKRWDRGFTGESVYPSGTWDNGQGVTLTLFDDCWGLHGERQLVVNAATGDDWTPAVRDADIPTDLDVIGMVGGAMSFTCDRISDERIIFLRYAAGICYGIHKDNLNMVIAYDFETGELRWETTFPFIEYLSFSEHLFGITGPTGETPEAEYSLSRINVEDGSIMWTLNEEIYPIYGTDTSVLLESRETGSVVLVNARTGVEKWRSPYSGDAINGIGDGFYISKVTKKSDCKPYSD